MLSIIREIRDTKDKEGLLYAIYFSLSLTLCVNPLAVTGNKVTKFKRVIGIGIINNIDVSRRIGNFFCWFLIFVVTFSFFYVLAVYLKKIWSARGKETRVILALLKDLIILADINLLFRGIFFFRDWSSGKRLYDYPTGFLALTVFALIFYAIFDLERRISSDQYLMLCVVMFTLGLPIAILSRQEWRLGRTLLGIQVALFLAGFILLRCCAPVFQKKQIRAVMVGSVVSLSLLPFLTSFYEETVNVLNQYGVFITLLGRYYAGVVLFLFLAALVVVLMIATGRLSVHNWKTWSYPWLVFGVSCLSVQLPLEQEYTANIYESANYSILISDFLNYGSIPIIEHYGGHMMTGVWEGLLYALVNRDFEGAIFSPYAGYLATLLAVLFFYLVKTVWNEDAALFAALFFPFLDSFDYFGLGVLVCLAILSFVRKNSCPRAHLVMGAVVWCALYRLDLGFSFGIAGMAALCIYVIIYKHWRAARQLIGALACWGCAGGVLWFGLCALKRIQPLDRLIEFLTISASNQNWAYKGIGYPEDTLFVWAYLIVPFIVGICLLYSVFSREFREKTGREIWILLLVLGIAYFTNFPRGLVRHSLQETDTAVVFWSANLFLAIFGTYFKGNPKIFLPLFTSLILLQNSFVTVEGFHEESIGKAAVEKLGDRVETWRFGGFSDTESQTYWTDIRDNRGKVNRVVWDEGLQDRVKPFEMVLNTLLDEDETYVDFINASFIYSAIDRYDPVYVSQSPMQLSGEKAQEYFIGEIMGIPLVLMPVSEKDYARNLDEIENAYRYYKVAEYLYQNYVPLCQVNDVFAVWCLKERYDEMYSKAIGLTGEQITMIGYGYDGPEKGTIESQGEGSAFENGFHNYELTWLPRIWAEEEKTLLNPLVSNVTQTEEYYLIDNFETKCGEKGNYLLASITYDGVYEDQEGETIPIEMIAGNYANGEFCEKYRYRFLVEEGTHNYIIRISSDYYWYLKEVNAIKVLDNSALRDVQLKILEGD